jgi:phosphoribosyl 1,2-cyclic phosphodiesterase
MDELEILCLGSGSSGNCYLLGKAGEYIMVECGLPFKTIVSKLTDYDVTLDQIKAVVVSHAHKDHSESLTNFQNLDIPVFAPYLYQHQHGPCYLTEWMRVVEFPVEHDVPCFGFVFLTKDKESVLFLTDTRYIESKYFKYKYTYIMVECNHIRKQLEVIMDRALKEGNAQKVFKFKRQASYHLSLAGVKKMLKGMDLSETKAIFLMHLSKECCNDAIIKAEVEAKFHKRTLVCYREGRIN